MTLVHPHSDRRTEPRYEAAGQITWRRPTSRVGLLGWLDNSSRSGVAFVAAARLRPIFGEQIEVRGPNQNTQFYRVTRVTPRGEELSLVACQAVALSGTQTTVWSLSDHGHTVN